MVSAFRSPAHILITRKTSDTRLVTPQPPLEILAIGKTLLKQFALTLCAYKGVGGMA